MVQETVNAEETLRREQLDINEQGQPIRACEQRNEATGDDAQRADGDLKSEVRSKLEANLPASALAVDAQEGVVTDTGTVVDDAQLQKIKPLALEIKGVKSVNVTATVNSAAKPSAAAPETKVPLDAHTGSK